MKYIALYVPFEGEVKTGTLAYDIVNPNYKAEVFTARISNGILYDDRGYVRDIKDCKVAKLCVCSLDIREGDKVMHISGVDVICQQIDTEEEAGEGNRQYLYAIEEQYPQHEIPLWLDECFKVIGQISEDALPFVNVKQVLDVDDIKVYEDQVRIEGRGTVLVRKCQIKCPWGHYH